MAMNSVPLPIGVPLDWQRTAASKSKPQAKAVSFCWDDSALDLEPPPPQPLRENSLPPRSLAPLAELSVEQRGSAFAKNKAVVAAPSKAEQIDAASPPKAHALAVASACKPTTDASAVTVRGGVPTCKKAAPTVRAAPQVSSKISVAASVDRESDGEECNKAMKLESATAELEQVRAAPTVGKIVNVEVAPTARSDVAAEDACKSGRGGLERPKSESKAVPSVGIGLSWRGRWGGWSHRGVHVLAACVGVFQASHTGAMSKAEDLDVTLAEVEKALKSEMPPGSLLAAVHWAPNHAGNRTLRAAVAGDPLACEQLELVWQRRKFGINGSVSVTWSFTFDSASADHCQRVASVLKRDGGAHQGFVLELPARWFDQEFKQLRPGDERQEVLGLQKGDHWFDFASLFGEVSSAEVFAPASDGSIAYLLVQFAHVDGAHSTYEALTDRYLFHPGSKVADDCHPVTCAICNYSTMRQSLTSSMRQSSARSLPAFEETKFELHRHGIASAAGCVQPPPEVIPITVKKRWIIVGRDDACDIMLKHPHISKSHAALALQQHPVSGEWQLMVQDTSSNGTWLNNTRIPKGKLVQAQIDERISFLQPVPSMDGVLTYGVMSSKTGLSDAKSIASSSHREERSRSRDRVRTITECKALELGPASGASRSSQLGQHSDPHEEDISIWLRRFGIDSLLQYEMQLIQQYDTVSQIRELYKDNIEAFFEDCSIEDVAHRALFKAAIRSHLGAPPIADL